MSEWFIEDSQGWRLFASYVAQMVISILLLFIFRYYGRLYKRHFLKLWSWMWAAYFVHLLAISFITIVKRGTLSPIEMAFWGSYPQNAGVFIQLLLLVAGTKELITNKRADQELSRYILLALVFAGFCSFLFVDNPEASQERYFLRIGIRSFLSGLAFSACGLITLYHKRFKGVVGQKLLGISFLIFGIVQLQHFSLVVVNITGYSFAFPLVYYGIIELLLISIMGMGMVIWLLEDERRVLHKTNQELDSFLYRTSHDLKAPIASVLGLTNLAKYEVKEAKATEYFGMIEERVKKLDELMADILTFSKSGKMDLQLESIDFDQLLQSVLSDMQFVERAQRINLKYTPASSHKIFTDARQLRIILHNLISNAIKYHDLSKEKPFIEIRFSRSQGLATIEIEDNGMGMDAESLPRIFEMFYRGTEKSDGSGLGLYIVKQALDKIKASIKVRSKFGVGSCFTVEVPS